MKFKKGDIIQKINTNKKHKRKRMYLIVSIKEEKGIYITARIEVALDDKEKMKWHYNLINNNDMLLIKYDYFTILEENEIMQSDYILNKNPINLIRKLYELREETDEERRKERKEKYQKSIKQKIKRDKLARMCKKNSVKESQVQMKGIHDSTYKGRIKIVRG